METLLQWERWLKSSSMEKKHVREARDKHRWIMYLMKKVGKRAARMQLKLTKFHGIVHMADDIFNFGVPMEVDTGSNESGHKATKTAARLTQKNEDTFDHQTAKRLEEVHLLDLAVLEISGYPVHNYGNHQANAREQTEESEDITQLGGAELRAKYDREQEEDVMVMVSKTRNQGDDMVEKALISFMIGLQESLKDHLHAVPLRTMHKRNGQIFRGDNKFRGHVWRDWALFDWGDNGKLPQKLYGFVDLSALPKNINVEYADIHLEAGVFAVVENATFDDNADQTEMSEIFVPITKEVGDLTDDGANVMHFYLADVEAILEPMAVIPDLGGNSNAYLQVKPREQWKNDFMNFLERDLNIEEEMSTEEEEDSTEGESSA